MGASRRPVFPAPSAIEEGRIDGKTRTQCAAGMRRRVGRSFRGHPSRRARCALLRMRSSCAARYPTLMVRRRKAPSPDDASHRRENHAAVPRVMGRKALIRSSSCGTRQRLLGRAPLVVYLEPPPDSRHEAAIAFTLPAIGLILLKKLPILAELACGTWWPSCLRLEAAQSGIPRYCVGAGDRLKRSQKIKRLTRRS